MNIVVIGVGYVGLVTGLGLAQLNHNIQFLDIDINKINKLKNKISPFYEPLLDKNLNDADIAEKVSFHSEYVNVNWTEVDIIMICVQTPTSFNNEVDPTYLINVFESISAFVDQNKIICIKSTIHPDALDETLEASKFSQSQIVFNPEFLREGSAFQDFFNPDRIVIGSINKTNAKKVALLYKDLITETIFTDPISSQLIKYLSNAYLPLRLSFVNEASQLIKALGGNLSETLHGIGLDSRIGSEYFRPSAGWGGSCFPKDVAEINSVINEKNLNTPLISNIINSNNQHQIWFSEYVIEQKKEEKLKHIILIGLSFKENTDDTRHSPTIAIYDILNSKGESVKIFDLNTEKFDNYNIINQLEDQSLVLEMFPIDKEYAKVIKDELSELNQYKYLRFWE
jgi:UDPglucose 6-dehydrogenase